MHLALFFGGYLTVLPLTAAGRRRKQQHAEIPPGVELTMKNTCIDMLPSRDEKLGRVETFAFRHDLIGNRIVLYKC